MPCVHACVRARVWAGGCVDGWAVVRWVDVRMDVWLCVVLCGFVWLCVVVCGVVRATVSTSLCLLAYTFGMFASRIVR